MASTVVLRLPDDLFGGGGTTTEILVPGASLDVDIISPEIEGVVLTPEILTEVEIETDLSVIVEED